MCKTRPPDTQKLCSDVLPASGTERAGAELADWKCSQPSTIPITSVPTSLHRLRQNPPDNQKLYANQPAAKDSKADSRDVRRRSGWLRQAHHALDPLQGRFRPEKFHVICAIKRGAGQDWDLTARVGGSGAGRPREPLSIAPVPQKVCRSLPDLQGDRLDVPPHVQQFLIVHFLANGSFRLHNHRAPTAERHNISLRGHRWTSEESPDRPRYLASTMARDPTRPQDDSRTMIRALFSRRGEYEL